MRSSGFTIIEILIAISIAAAIFLLIGLFTAQSEFQSLELERAESLIRSELVRARTDTTSGTQDTGWGVAFTANSLTRFAGASYAGRNQTFDVTIPFNSTVTISGPAEIVFTRPDGLPANAGTISVTNGRHTVAILVNTAGAISIQK